ncbi:glutaredoxin domain-containing protein [Dehalogenimonas etheniformans]|uniref:NrdH-redoxin n=1 Tax=Dehalogenimonas etheniformans TaxID=1536648 RepID=A0A2P5P8V8_9CHLR|nr:glutaredoxin domain-containing protein [Dehalogenimonas etheniformans]PPD58742.1 NrdH-redoxin [Dehalogenimonas etheniformans]QNT76489.1 NrdH-redoxin [Dehalogenimonas etheniformans]
MAEVTKLYGTSWCPHTSRSRAILDRQKVSYTWIDIERDPSACTFVERTNKGNRSVPTIVFPDGSILVEPADFVLIQKCEEITK